MKYSNQSSKGTLSENKFVKKGLFVKQGEVVTPKLMVFVKHNIEPLYGERAAIMSSMQVDQTGHWSHWSDLPSQSAPPGCTTICDTCYLSNC